MQEDLAVSQDSSFEQLLEYMDILLVAPAILK